MSCTNERQKDSVEWYEGAAGAGAEAMGDDSVRLSGGPLRVPEAPFGVIGAEAAVLGGVFDTEKERSSGVSDHRNDVRIAPPSPRTTLG